MVAILALTLTIGGIILNNETNDKFESKLDDILSNDSDRNAKETLMKNCRKSLDMIEKVLLGFYFLTFILEILPLFNGTSSYTVHEFAPIFRRAMESILLYVFLEYIKKGHKNIAIIPFISSILYFIMLIAICIFVPNISQYITDSDLYTLSMSYMFLILIIEIISMAYVLFDADIKKYCEYMKTK